MEKKKTTKKKKTVKKKKQPEGLGDVVETVLEKTGVAKVAKWILGEDCGCDDRKKKLNELFPRWRNPQCLQEEEYNWLKKWFSEPRGKMKSVEQQAMLKIYNRVFKTNQRLTTCSSCLRDINQRMNKIYIAYKEENE